MPLDHISIPLPTSQLPTLLTWLTQALAPIGIKEIMRPVPHAIGLGDSRPFLWLVGIESDDTAASEGAERRALGGVHGHVAFTASSVREVRQFHSAAIQAGGVDNGKPGPRPQYHPGYYGAFVRDPVCGINFEVVFHACPEDEDQLRRLEEADS